MVRRRRKNEKLEPSPLGSRFDLLAEAVENCTEMIGMADAQGRFTFANRALLETQGYSREEVIGKHFEVVLAKQNSPELLQEIGTKCLTDDGWRGECLGVRRDGSVFPLFLSVGPAKDKDGRIIGSFGIAQDISERKKAEEALRQAHLQLSAALRGAEQQARDSLRLTELVDILQSCQTVEEAYRIVGNALPTVLSSQCGVLCVTSSSRNIVEVVSMWGDSVATEKTFAPDNCWALRRGKIHRVNDPASPLRCAHVRSSSPNGYVCVPLAAQGETLGVLHVVSAVSSSAKSESQMLEMEMQTLARQATEAGERISLALANLKLREVLRSQSIRDPLTGLFNRRYMEESLERELHRASRGQQHVSLLMLDLDHFKHFNDMFGHQAGDRLLRALGDFLLQRTRGQDVPCRFGGEEFALILAGATLESACKRAGLLCQEVKQLAVEQAGQVLGKVTFSIGVSSYPEHGLTVDELIRHADQALYRAKSEGRDRVVVASESSKESHSDAAGA